MYNGCSSSACAAHLLAFCHINCLRGCVGACAGGRGGGGGGGGGVRVRGCVVIVMEVARACEFVSVRVCVCGDGSVVREGG